MSSSRKRAAVADEIISWLDMNYELSDGVCLPRSLLYQHYSDSCATRRTPVIGAAAFGKMVRRKFNTISTRRLGTRGQSKYHYYGLAVKRSSKYYEPSTETASDSNTLPGFSVFKSKVRQETSEKKVAVTGKDIPEHRSVTERNDLRETEAKESDDVRLGRAIGMLSKFPSTVNLCVPPGVPCSKLETFLNMYGAHCRNLMHAVSCSLFEDLPIHMKHFWNEIPVHLSAILESDFVANVIEICDILFYEAVDVLLLPSDLDNISDHVTMSMEVLLEKMPIWITDSIRHLPRCVSCAKTRAVDDFVKSVRRHLSLIPVIRSCSLIMSQPSTLRKMVMDLKRVDFSPILEDVNLLIEPQCLSEVQCLMSFFAPNSESEEEPSPSTNTLSLHVKESVERFVMRSEQSLANNSSCLIGRGCLLLLAIGRAFSSLSRELTLINSSSFGYWFLFSVLINDLALIAVESLIRRENYNAKRSSLSRRYFQPEQTSFSQEKEYILQLL